MRSCARPTRSLQALSTGTHPIFANVVPLAAVDRLRTRLLQLGLAYVDAAQGVVVRLGARLQGA